jgi:N-acetyltransferase
LIDPKPIVLEGHGLRLEPISLAHEAGLREAACDGALWNLRVTSVPEPDKVQAYIDAALAGLAAGNRIAWVVIEQSTGRVLGSSSYHDILVAVDRVEIGYTWYRKSVQRSFVNTACKIVLMQHAFETLGCKVVGWRTDIFNFASQRAIERLGAKRDGVIRHHALRRDSTVRDTVMYSMLLEAWPKAKENLLVRLLQTNEKSKEIVSEVNAKQPSIDQPAAQIELVTITEDNVNSVLKLEAGANGLRMVATNGNSIAQATYNKNARQFGIQRKAQDDQPALMVGYLLLWDPSLHEQTKEPVDQLYVWRLMIDFRYQGKGYGTQVLREVQKIATSISGIKQVALSHQMLEHNPRPFYETLGFVSTGVIEDEEAQMIWKVPT